jgi:hypothetical protein
VRRKDCPSVADRLSLGEKGQMLEVCHVLFFRKLTDNAREAERNRGCVRQCGRVKERFLIVLLTILGMEIREVALGICSG